MHARERYKHLRLMGWPNGWGFLGKHPELDEYVQEILDEAGKHRIIRKIWVYNV